MFDGIRPSHTATTLLAVLALHLLHHRIAKRHIGFTEFAAATLLLAPLSLAAAEVMMAAHLAMTAVLTAGSLWIKRLSPSWPPRPEALP